MQRYSGNGQTEVYTQPHESQSLSTTSWIVHSATLHILKAPYFVDRFYNNRDEGTAKIARLSLELSKYTWVKSLSFC